VAVFLAFVARLHGRLCAVHVFRDGIRRSQTVPGASEESIIKQRTAGGKAYSVPRHMVWPAAAVTFDGGERSDVKTASRRRCARRKATSAATSTATRTTTVLYSVIRTHTRDMPKVSAVLPNKNGYFT
jgi:hypothetical protein